MTIEHAPGTNGHRGPEGAGDRQALPPEDSVVVARKRPVGPDAGRGSGRTAHRRVPLDLRGLVASAMVAAGVVLILRRIDRGASR